MSLNFLIENFVAKLENNTGLSLACGVDCILCYITYCSFLCFCSPLCTLHIVIISVNAVKVTANRLGGQCDASVLS